MRPLFATLEKDARFSRARNFARARAARQNFFEKTFEFIEGLNICQIRMAGKTLVRPENGRYHGIYRTLARLGPKNHMKKQVHRDRYTFQIFIEIIDTKNQRKFNIFF